MADIRAGIAAAIAAFVFVSPCARAEEEKVLPLDNVTMVCYALGGDTATLKDPVEAVYVTKGTPTDAINKLKDVLIEGGKEQKSFRLKDPLCITVFRGFFPGLSKVFIKKVSLKGNKFDVYAEYRDSPEYSTPSQPAAIIPLGQLPPGDYTVNLYVANELRKKADFKVKGR